MENKWAGLDGTINLKKQLHYLYDYLYICREKLRKECNLLEMSVG